MARALGSILRLLNFQKTYFHDFPLALLSQLNDNLETAQSEDIQCRSLTYPLAMSEVADVHFADPH